MKKKEVGQGLVEYALVLVLVAIVVIAVLMLLGPIVGNTFNVESIESLKEAANEANESLEESVIELPEAIREAFEILFEHCEEEQGANEEFCNDVRVGRDQADTGDFAGLINTLEKFTPDRASLPPDPVGRIADHLAESLVIASERLVDKEVPASLCTAALEDARMISPAAVEEVEAMCGRAVEMNIALEGARLALREGACTGIDELRKAGRNERANELEGRVDGGCP